MLPSVLHSSNFVLLCHQIIGFIYGLKFRDETNRQRLLNYISLNEITVDSLAQIQDADEYARKENLPRAPFVKLVQAVQAKVAEKAPKGMLSPNSTLKEVLFVSDVFLLLD